MADFDVNTITVQGAVAIASATAGDKLVIDGCDATTDVLTQAQAVQIATRPSSPASTTDTIGLAGSTDNHVYAYASFIRGESTGGDVHSFLLYGHMESDATTVFVVAVASATAPTHIPASGDVTNRVEIQFELTFSATDEVVTVTDTSMYTTRGEFLILKNRTVTTHAEGQATVGEDQTVYGKKEFMDDMIFNGLYQVQAKAMEGQNTQNLFAFTQNGDRQTLGPTITAMTTYNGTSYVSSTTSIGATAILGVAGGAVFSAEHKAVGDSNAAMEATRGLGGAHAGVVVEPTQVTLYTQAASGGARRTLSYTGGQLTGSFNTISTSSDELDIYIRASAADIDMYFDATTPDSSLSVDLTNVSNEKTTRLQFYSGADSGGQLICESATGGVSKLGTEDTPWNEAHISDVYTTSILTESSEMNITTYGSSSRTYYSDIYLLCDDPDDPGVKITLKPEDGTESEYGFYSGYFAAPGKNLGYANGGEWNNVYASGIASLHDIQTDIIRKRGGTGNIGLWANLVPNTTDPVSLGSTSFSFSDVYANKLHGIMPYMDGTGSTPPVGAFFLACIDTVSTGPAFTIGDVLDMSKPGVYGISTMTVANNVDATTWTASTSWRITTGKYAVLSNGSAQTATRVICLLMRIE